MGTEADRLGPGQQRCESGDAGSEHNAGSGVASSSGAGNLKVAGAGVLTICSSNANT